MLGLAEAPVIVRQADDRAVLELALIENLQREDLNPIEEAHGYSQLIEQFQLRQEEAAAKVGKSRAVVANALRLLKLAPDLQVYVREGRLSVGHAKVILGLTGPEEQKFAVVQRIADEFSKTNEVITIDGARILFANGWGLVRASNTQAILVLRFEADSDEHLAEIRSNVESKLKAIMS